MGVETKAEFLTARDVARMTGVSQLTIRKVIATGDLPAAKIGRRVVIFRRDLDPWLERCRALAIRKVA